MTYYFAYGSNMDEDRMSLRMSTTERRYSEISKGTAKLIGIGKLFGWKLIFNKLPSNGSVGEGFANITKKTGSIVEGIIYEIDKVGLDRLDKSEGVPENYVQKELIVKSNQKELSCITYIAVKTKENLKPSKEYLSHFLKARKYLSKEYFQKLTEIVTFD